ncbi:uncharacterized protein LOC143299551 [Babylonia areolata]|uniref:uncharacterized protein LOC143299551 n=1 Tax=Babylonia areolata TaxID=304850 RepID=UPI003FCFA980
MVQPSVCLRRLFVLHVVVLAWSHHDAKARADRAGEGGGGWGEEEGGEGCDPKFRRNVESCLESLQGFHVMTRHKTLLLGDWRRTDFICMFQLMQVVGVCLTSLYALNPRARRWRSLCGFQSVDPRLLSVYGQAVCRNKDVLKEHGDCLRRSQGVMEGCLYHFHARIPSRLSTGMWKEPLYSPHCSYQAYAEHCYEKHMFGRCSLDLYYAHLDILKATRPATCSWKDVDLLKRRFREAESYIVYYSNGGAGGGGGSCAWLGLRRRGGGGLTAYLLLAVAVSVVVSLGTVEVLGVG